jgi:hypothetical protein
MTDVDTILAQARSHLGMSGRPNAATQWYARDGHGVAFLDASWCDMFVSWCAHNVGMTDIVGEFAYTPSHVNWFKKNKRWDHTPKRGAVVFFDWNNDNVSDHVGFVEAVRSDGLIVTIEGNTGNACKRKVRSPSDVLGYGHPAYKTGGTPQPVTHAYPGHMTARGATGPVVGEIQTALNKDGAKLKVDNDFGPMTESVVRTFQRKNKLVDDGIVGPRTWKALFG